MNRAWRHLAIACLCTAFAVSTQAAGFPDRPVKMIVPWAAGGDTDNIFRPFAQAYQKALGGTPVVVANIGGASGTVGAREAKAAPADGYTLFAEHDFIHSTYYTGMSDINYTDFEPICLISSTPSVLTASPKTKWTTLKELVDDARARPGQISVGATLGSTSHFFPALFEKAAKLKLKYVSYDGLAQRMNAILGGHTDLTDGNLTQKGKVDAGQLKFLAIGTEKRSPELPNVPTFKELGYNVEYYIWAGIFAPKATPEAVIKTLRDATRKAVEDADFRTAMVRVNSPIQYLDAPEFAKYWASDARRLAEVVKAIGKVEEQK
jgi:tripartite-type tricarboxylate transporter receptor subunit TctC